MVCSVDYLPVNLQQLPGFDHHCFINSNSELNAPLLDFRGTSKFNGVIIQNILIFI